MTLFISRRNGRTIGAMLGLIVLAQPTYAAPSFQGLGDLPGGTVESLGFGVSRDGSVVVGQSRSGSDSGNVIEAFRWTQSTGMIGLGDLSGGGFRSRAWGASADGSVVVGSGNSGTLPDARIEAMRWSQSTGMLGLGDLPGGDFWSEAYGVSANGSVIFGRSLSGGGWEAFRWTQSGGMIGLGFMPGRAQSFAASMSADGGVIAGRSYTIRADFTEEGEAFRWTQGGGMVGLGFLPGRQGLSFAADISSDGAVIVGSSANPSDFSMTSYAPEAFRWTAAGGMAGLGFLPGHAHSTARATSGDGSVVIGSSWMEQNQQEIFIWEQAAGMRNLRDLLTSQGGDLTGWSQLFPSDISDDGTVIVGHGLNPAGQIEGWVAVVPEPTSVALLAMGLPLLLRRRVSDSGKRDDRLCLDPLDRRQRSITL